MTEKVKVTAQDIRTKILAAKDSKAEKMEIEEWGVTIWIHSLKYRERTKLLTDAGMTATGNKGLGVKEINNFIMNLIQTTARDEDGNQIFTKEDIKKLENMNSEIIDRIAGIATELSGLGAEGRARIKNRFQK